MVTSKKRKTADNNCMFNMNGFCINNVAASFETEIYFTLKNMKQDCKTTHILSI